MSRTIGIDPSLTSTGVVGLVDARPVAIRSVGHYARDPKSYPDRSDRMIRQARAVIEIVTTFTGIYGAPDVIVLEGPAYGACNAFTHDGSGLWWYLYSTIRARRIPIAVVAPKTRALFATGNGNASKKQVTTEAQTWWPGKIGDREHDQADAGVMALMAALHLGDPMPFAVKPQHYHRMEVVKWPIPGVEARFTEEGVLW